MAIIPSAEYPGQIDLDPTDYPQGKARNAGSYQDGTGTPLEETWLNDLWGFLQALLAAAEITPTGDPDTATASQYLDAVRSVATTTTGARHLRSLMQLRLINTDGVAPSGPPNDALAVASAGGRSLIVRDGAQGVFRLGDTSIVSLNNVTATGLGNAQGIADSGSRHVAVGSATSSFSTNDGSSWTAGGSLPSFTASENGVVWTGTHFVAMDGSKHTARSTNGVAWTAAATAPTLTNSDGLAQLTGGTLITISSKTVSVSTDHGDTWTTVASIPSAMAGTLESYCAGNGDGEVYAFLKVGGFTPEALVECWVTTNGSTWAKRSEFEIPNGDLGVDLRALQCEDTGLLVVMTAINDDVGLCASVDLGRTWSTGALYDDLVMAAIAVAQGRIFGAVDQRIFASDPLMTT